MFNHASAKPVRATINRLKETDGVLGYDGISRHRDETGGATGWIYHVAIAIRDSALKGMLWKTGLLRKKLVIVQA